MNHESFKSNQPLPPIGTYFANKKSAANFAAWVEALNNEKVRTPMLVITGPRRCGKTHFANSLFPSRNIPTIHGDTSRFQNYAKQLCLNDAVILDHHRPSLIDDPELARYLQSSSLPYHINRALHHAHHPFNHSSLPKLATVIITAPAVTLCPIISNYSHIVELGDRNFL